MNIDYMYLHDAEVKSLKQEIIDFSNMICEIQNHIKISEGTFEHCRSFVKSIQDEINELDAGKEKFLGCIQKLSNPQYIQVITERHFYNKKWDDIKVTMGISHIQERIYPKAKAEFISILESA